MTDDYDFVILDQRAKASAIIKRRSFFSIYLKIKNKTLCVLAFVLDTGSAFANAHLSGMTMILGGGLKAFNEKTCFFLKNGLWERALERKENTHD